MACCKNDLGSFPHNKDINTGLQAAQSGMHELMFTGPNFTRFSKYLNVSIGEDIVIPQGILNEDCVYAMVITQPDGTTIEQDACENFAFRTFINKVVCDDIEYL